MTLFHEAITLPHGYFLEALPERFRVRRLMPWEPPPRDEHVEACGDEKTTRHLMAGACYAAMSHAVALDDGANAVDVPVHALLLHHVHQLSGAYQTTHATPPVMRAVAARMQELQREDVATHCLKVAEEESGHDTLALKDLAALGLSAQQLVSDYQPSLSLQLVALFRELAQSAEPISVLGYVYTLERFSLFKTEAHIAAIEKEIPSGIKATRCMRVHSAVGSDAGHVDEALLFITGLPSTDRAAIARAVYASTLLLFGKADYPGDTVMHEILLQYGWSSGETCTEARLTA